MKLLYTLTLASLLYWSLSAQTIVPVPQGNGTLNDAIQNYIDTNGGVDDSVIFELESGGIYVLTSTIDFDYDLNIQAAADYEVRPVILPALADGGETFRPFRVRENITLRGLYVTTEDALGGRSDQIIRISNDEARIIIDDCHLDKATQSALRIDNEDNKIYMTNSIVSNIINLQNPSNGRGFDDRGQDIDTLWVENSTFYNLTARLLRDDGGEINWLLWNQNTSVNTGDRTLDIGEGLEVRVTNNLFINPAFLGDDDNDATAFQIDESDDEMQNVVISHNNFYNDPALLEIYDAINVNAEEGDSVYVRRFLNGTASDFVSMAGLDSTIYNQEMDFINAPATPTEYVRTFYDDPTTAVPIDDGNGGAGPDNVAQVPFDFCYSRANPMASAGTEGQALGDPNWTSCVTSSTKDIGKEIDLQLYPNPFSTQLNYELTVEKTSEMDVILRNVLGQVVYQERAAAMIGFNRFTLNLDHLNNGYYYLTIQMEDGFFTIKVLKTK
ncbi:MAG: T9SS type A sorting domain-containing protein [Bacteroidota bacterium]